jgi:hypothetical protein
MAEFLDQVFCTGINVGWQAMVEKNINDQNPFNVEWLDGDIGEGLVQDSEGEQQIISPLSDFVKHITEFNYDTIPDDIAWFPKIVLPKNTGEGHNVIEGEDGE